jgi:hypothetical protein
MTGILFISLINLIQHPDVYHDEKVRMVALATIAFEGKALYINKDDLENGVSKNAIWLEIPIDDTTKAFDRRYVIVEGTFNKNKLGHLGMYSGTLQTVTRIELWKDDK